MIDLSFLSGKQFAIFGLGKSGLSTARALQAGGATVKLWDDNEHGRTHALNAGFDLQNLYETNLSQFDGLILSPGVPLTHPVPHDLVKAANAANISVIGDVELFLQAIKQVKGAKFIAVTGTNGKSTTVSLIHHILYDAGLNVHLGGNIGSTAVLDMAEVMADHVYVVELSSYQIDLMPSLQKVGFAPDVSVLINVSADHIDRHGTIENYANVKSQIFKNQHSGDLAIIGVDDEFGIKFAQDYVCRPEHGQLIRVAATNKQADIFCVNGSAVKNTNNENENELFNLDSAIRLQGVHNLQNAAIAYEIAKYFNIDDQKIKAAMHSFSGLEHRMETVGRILTADGEILFINDSKATNAEAVKPALGAYQQVYWLVGGLAKEGGLQSLKGELDNVKKAYLFGSSAQEYANNLVGVVNFEVFLKMEDAINKALTEIVHSNLKGQKVVLLSPAAASFDQFKNFEARGNRFKKIVKKRGAKLI